MEYPIPRKSAEAWRKHQGKPSQNPGLVFDRFVPIWEGQPKLKKDGLEAVRRASERGRVDERLFMAWNARWEATVRHANADPFALKTDWRFIAGLGRKGSLEVGFTFHRYGFPILPGSSVKGIARAWSLISLAALLDAKNMNDLDKILNLDDEKEFSEAFSKSYSQASAQDRALVLAFRTLFGTTGAAGGAVFFDAIPRQMPKLELDIMNPHYPKYYQGNEPPTDSQNPIPVYFLTVAPSTEFRFAVGWRGVWNDEARRLRALAQDWLIKGLTELGAGAKTSAGYGYFVPTRR
jgi:CRISPR-associated protein Cmr6